jgi:hypothetical protein
VLLIPWVAPTVVSALNFLWIYDYSLGVLNYLLVRVFRILPQGVGWLSEPGTAMASVIAVNVWRGFLSLPFNPSRCSEDRRRPFVRSPGLGSERTPRVPCGVSDARRRKAKANGLNRPTGNFRVAGAPQAGPYAARRP